MLVDGLMPAEATQGLVDDATVKLMEDLKEQQQQNSQIALFQNILYSFFIK